MQRDAALAEQLATATDVFNVKSYGAMGDGATDDTAAIQAAIDAGNNIYFPAGTYVLSDVLKFNAANQVLFGQSSDLVTLSWPVTLGAATIGPFGAGTAAIDVNGNANCSIKNLAISGPTALNTFVGNETGVVLNGTSTSVRVSGFSVIGVEISGFGSYGMLTHFVDNITVNQNYFHDIGYTGVSFVSSNRGEFVGNRIETVKPGTSGDAYAMSLTHFSANYNTNPNPGTKSATHPFCWGWVVAHNHIDDMAINGLDAHGGYELQFVHNTIYSCQRSIQLAGGSGDATGYGGFGNVIAYNVCDARKSDGSASGNENTRAGIEFGTGGTPIKRHLGVIVVGNQLYAHGQTSGLGALRGNDVDGAVVADNVIKSWGGRAIEIGPLNSIVRNNIIGDVATAGDTSKRAIESQPGITTGKMIVTGNILVNEGGTAPTTGFHFGDLTTRPTITDNDFSRATNHSVANVGGVHKGTDLPQKVLVTDDATTQDVGFFQSGLPSLLQFENTTPITVTDLTGGITGQIVILYVGTANSITLDSANALLSGSANWVGNIGDTLTLFFDGANWVEISRSVNG